MLKNLQLLRAFAALSVVFHHYNFLNFHPGAFGVDIFFVISGFIISYTIEKDSTDFFIKRLRRIAPMYYMATAMVIIIWHFNPNVFKNTFVDLSSILKSLLFIPYSKGPILGLGYTLNYEMYFYVITGVFLKFAKSFKNALVYASILLVSICLFNYLISTKSFVINFYGYNIILEFIYGIILFFIYSYYKTKPISKIWIYNLLILSILAFIFLIYIGYPEIPLRFRGFLFGFPAFIICAFFVFSDGRFRTDSVLFRYFFNLGNASFVMYLIHPFVVFGVLRLIHPLLNSENIILKSIELLITVALVCIASTLIYKRVELPMQKILKRARFMEGETAKFKSL